MAASVMGPCVKLSPVNPVAGTLLLSVVSLICPKSRSLIASRRLLHEINESAKRSGQMTATGVVEEGSRKTLPPGFEHRLQRAAFKVARQPVVEGHDDSQAGNGAAEGEVAGSSRPNGELPGRIDTDDLAVLLELVGRN